MADRQCVAILTTGLRCSKLHKQGGNRCSMHTTSLIKNGPNTTALKEMKYVQDKARAELNAQWQLRINQETNEIRKNDMRADRETEISQLIIRNGHQLNLLARQQRDEVIRTGIDPDREANERRDAEIARRNEQRRQQWDMFNAAREARNEQAALLAAAQRARIAVQPRGELEAFVNDNQNVHLTKTVEMVKKMVTKIREVPVPEGYRWNMEQCSKTPGEIIIECKLSPKAAWQMSAKYCQDENIYEMGNGIYGKVLDSVWQYIVASPDKADLCRCLKQEMEDNIGMCAQGNLSRLCNIVAGYLEGVEPKESVSEILGRLFPMLMEIENIIERLHQAFKILKENEVKKDEWKDWIDPLLLDQDERMDIRFIKNAENEVTGFVAVML